MDNLIKYLVDSLIPRDNTEFIILDSFDIELYNNMKQDGIMILKNIQSIDSTIDQITVGNFKIIRKNFPKQIEWLDSNGGFNFVETDEPLYRRLIPPPLETVNHVFMISSIIIESGGFNKTYIEYGVRHGHCIEHIANFTKKLYGVDMNPYQPKNNKIVMHCSTTDEFSKNILPYIKFDYCFIDADHKSSQVLIDFENVYRQINKGGYVFLHDTYPCNLELLKPEYCNDCYLSPLIIKNRFPDIEMITFPLNPGLTIIRK
jgi:hypothetical protein